MEERRRVPKSLFVLLTCGLLAFGALVMLVRMPRPDDVSGSVNKNHQNDDDDDRSPMTAALSTNNNNPNRRKNDRKMERSLQDSLSVCRSSQCLKTAYTLLDSMNVSVDPCQDFFSYACGGWIAKNPILPSTSKWSPFGKLDMDTNKLLQDILSEPQKREDPLQLNQAKDFYKACSDVEQLEKVGLKPVFQMLQLYGGWPILSPPGKWKNSSSSFNWMRSVADLKRMFGTSAILDIAVNQHSTTPSFSTIHLSQPSLFLSRPYFINKNKYQHYINAYRDLIVDIVQELKNSPASSGFPSLSGPINIKYIQEKALEIIAFEEEIAKLTRDPVEVQYGLRNFTATLTINYLQSIFNNYTTPTITNKLELLKFLEYTFRTTPGVKISDSQLVSLADTNYMGNIFELLSTTRVEVVANYLHFRMLGWIVSGTTKGMRSHIHKYQRVVYGITQPSPREYVCSSSTEEKFGLALSQPYLSKVSLGTDLVERATEMLERIRTSFITLLDISSMLSPSVKNLLRKKSRTITSCIGFPPWMAPNGSEYDKQTFKQHLDTHFAGLNIDNGGYLQKLWSVRTWLTDQKFKLLRERYILGCKWNTFPGEIGAFYDIRRQAVNVPLGLLQPPFFYDGSGVPIAINAGGLASILGHEFTHGFTVNGWTETASGKFSPISQCLINQYNKFKVNEINNMQINGELTLDENFPDTAGLFAAYKTFKTFSTPKTTTSLPGMEHFSQDQLFFIGFANIWCSSSRNEGLLDQVHQDHHTPNRYRVIGTLQNSKEFSDAWKCRVGSVMNPPKKCNAFM